MSIARGKTFGATEQVTNAKLHELVDSATILLENDEISTNMLTSLPSSAGTIPSYNLFQGLASGATLIYDGDRGITAA